MILLRAGIIVVQTVSITNLKMGIMCYWDVTRYHCMLILLSIQVVLLPDACCLFICTFFSIAIFVLLFFSFLVVPRTSSLFFIVQFVTVSPFVAFVRVIHLKCSSV